MNKFHEIKRRNLIISILFIVCIGVVSFGIVKAVNLFSYDSISADNNLSIINASIENLSVGKNLVIFNNYIEVKSLAKNNPEIETVSYFDEYYQKTIGYVNVFGGIGKNFLIVPGKEYEVSIKVNKKLILS